MCQKKQQEQGFQDVVNTNKIKFEPYLDLVDQHFLNSTRNQLTIKDQYCQKKKKMKHQGQNIPMKIIQKT